MTLEYRPCVSASVTTGSQRIDLGAPSMRWSDTSGSDGRPSWVPRGRPPISGEARRQWIQKHPEARQRPGTRTATTPSPASRSTTRSRSAGVWRGYVVKWNHDSNLLRDRFGEAYTERVGPQAVRWSDFSVYADHRGNDALARSAHGECHLEADHDGLLLTIRPTAEVDARLRELDRQARHTPIGGLGLSAEWDFTNDCERFTQPTRPYRAVIKRVRLVGIAVVADGRPAHIGTRLHRIEEQDFQRLQKLRAARAWRSRP